MPADKISRQQVSPATLLTNATIPAEQGQYVEAITQYSMEPELTDIDALFEPSDKFISKSRLPILPALTKINTDGTVLVCLMNATSSPITVYKNSTIGHIEPHLTDDYVEPCLLNPLFSSSKDDRGPFDIPDQNSTIEEIIVEMKWTDCQLNEEQKQPSSNWYTNMKISLNPYQEK